jgi:hypothetical protein
MAIIIDGDDMFIRRGDSAAIDLVFYDDDENGIKTDITGVQIYFTIRVPTDGEIVLQKITSLHEDPINGISNIELSYIDTDLEPRTYSYDIQIIMPDGQVHTIFPLDPNITGKFFVKKGVT